MNSKAVVTANLDGTKTVTFWDLVGNVWLLTRTFTVRA